MDEIKLKPCPFCGGKACLYVDNGIRVICCNCRARSDIKCDSFVNGKPTGSATKAVIEHGIGGYRMTKVEEIEKEYRENIERAMDQLSCEMPDYISEYGKAAYNVAIDAMEKQIPRKLHNEELGDGICACGCINFSKSFNYCPKCGQRILWEDAE